MLCNILMYPKKPQNPILRPKNPILFNDMTNFPTQTCPSCLMSMNIEQNPPSLSNIQTF